MVRDLRAFLCVSGAAQLERRSSVKNVLVRLFLSWIGRTFLSVAFTALLCNRGTICNLMIYVKDGLFLP
jgi:hypothetical protein